MGIFEQLNGVNVSQFELSEPSEFTKLLESSSALSKVVAVVVGLILYSTIVSCIHPPKLVTNAQYIGYRSWFEPTWLLRLRWSWDARRILTLGYERVRMTSPIKHCY